jgi:MarR family 2-MHQ and catechol resistance regulon transcriptional repressor
MTDMRFRGKPNEARALDAYIKLRRAVSSLLDVLDESLTEDGLTEGQWGVLAALHQLGPLTQHALGTKNLTSGANISIIVANLERRGWVARERDADDRRRVQVALTATGRRLVERVLPRQVALVVELLIVLGAREQEELGRMCRRLGYAARELLEVRRRERKARRRGAVG